MKNKEQETLKSSQKVNLSPRGKQLLPSVSQDKLFGDGKVKGKSKPLESPKAKDTVTMISKSSETEELNQYNQKKIPPIEEELLTVEYQQEIN